MEIVFNSSKKDVTELTINGTYRKKWYGTKNDVNLSIFLIKSAKCYSSLLRKIREIFTQMETNFNE